MLYRNSLISLSKLKNKGAPKAILKGLFTVTDTQKSRRKKKAEELLNPTVFNVLEI